MRCYFDPEMVVNVEGGLSPEVHLFEHEQDGGNFVDNLPSGLKVTIICVGGLVTYHAARPSTNQPKAKSPAEG